MMKVSPAVDSWPSDPQHERVFALIRSLATELHLPADRFEHLDLASTFDRDLGLDSLTRVELIARTERLFQVILPESAYREINSVGELIAAMKQAPQQRLWAPPSPVPIAAATQTGPVSLALPTQATTLVDVLNWHADRHGAREHITLSDSQASPPVSFAALREGARMVARGLAGRGIRHRDAVALMLPTGLEYFYSFFGILLLGAIPVPIYPPARLSQLEDHLRRHAAILNNCEARLLIATEGSRPVAQILKMQAVHVQDLVTVPQLSAEADALAALPTPILSSHDTAFLQYTSGSTGNPKGVILSHANILANIRAMGEAVCATPADVFVSWLPLYHDMGLIGAWFGSLYYAAHLVVMSPFAFLAKPLSWLTALATYHGTITSAPNFAYELCLRRISDAELAGLDLSSVRVMCNGSEAVSPSTIERFIERFAPYGLRPSALMPVYGLAEDTVGLTFPPLGRPPRIDVIERESFQRKQRAIPLTDGESQANLLRFKPLRFVACGRPLRGHEIRIVDRDDRELPERHEGYLQFRGPSATQSYWRNPIETKKLLHKNRMTWLDSGDLAYWAEGDLFVTGRVKDVIKHAGRNIYPEELEAAIGDLAGIRKGCVAVFGSADPKLGTERLIILAETRETSPTAQAAMCTRINREVASIIGSAPDAVVLAAPQTVLKTSSGKIRRAASKALFEAGEVRRPGEAGLTVVARRWPLLRFMLAALPHQVERGARYLWVRCYAVWMYAVVACLVVLVWPAVIWLPTATSRWWAAWAAARLATLLAGIRIRVEGREHLGPEACIFVANHTSYVDVLALTLALARPVTYVAKVELAKSWLFRWFLNGLGTEFVERFDQSQSLRDAQKLALAAASGKSLVFFPEGTFSRRAGLLPFFLGAFQIAAEVGRPIVPLAIRGARSILRDGSWIARPGEVVVTILPPIPSRVPLAGLTNNVWERAIWLRDAARAGILEANGEPDLGSVAGKT